jgi:hypothetical protein
MFLLIITFFLNCSLLYLFSVREMQRISASKIRTLHLSCRERCRRDAGEMQERCRRDAGEMQERCRRDAGEMQERCRRDATLAAERCASLSCSASLAA